MFSENKLFLDKLYQLNAESDLSKQDFKSQVIRDMSVYDNYRKYTIVHHQTR